MAIPNPNNIVNLSVAAHGAFLDVLLDSFDRALVTSNDPIDAARKVLELNIPLLAQLVGDAALASLLWGASSVGRRLPRTTIYGSPGRTSDITFNWDGNKAWMPVVNAAARAVGNLRPLLDWIFHAADARTRQNAFTVTGLATQRALEAVQRSLVRAINTGQGQTTWMRQAVVRKALATGPIGRAQANMIYRWNVGQGFHIGQRMILSDPIVGDNFPYVRVMVIVDSRLSDICREMSHRGIQGTSVFRRDDPAYVYNRSLRHIGCRCHDSPLTVRQAAELGIAEAIKWRDSGVPPTPHNLAHVPYFQLHLAPFLAHERMIDVARMGSTKGVTSYVS